MASRGINKVIIVGNLGKDPEQRSMPSGKAVTNITVATSEVWKDKQSGEQKEMTEWHRVVFFDRLAEIAGQYLKKGSKVYLEGRLQTRKYEKDGQTHYSTEIVANEMQMLDSRGSNNDGGSYGGANRDSGGYQGGSSNAGSGSARPSSPAEPDFDDDIPF